MHPDRTPTARRALARAARVLRDALQGLPEVRPADLDRIGRVLDDTMPAFRDAVEDATDARRITLDRAKLVADAAVSAGLASWDPSRDDAFTPADALRRRLHEMGGNLNGLRDDEADELANFIAAAQ
jgi:hypothetical protein